MLAGSACSFALVTLCFCLSDELPCAFRCAGDADERTVTRFICFLVYFGTASLDDVWIRCPSFVGLVFIGLALGSGCLRLRLLMSLL